MQPQAEFNPDHLRSECELFEGTILRDEMATDKELAPWRPGGEKNGRTDWLGWVRWYGKLQRVHGAAEALAAPTSSGGLLDHPEILAAMQDQPEVVPLADSDGPDGRKVVRCFPKSRDALAIIAACEMRRDRCLAERERLAASPVGLASESIDMLGEEVAYQYSLIVWIITHEGPWVPFDPYGPSPQIPAWIELLSEQDLAVVWEGCMRANAFRLMAAQRFSPKVVDPKAPPPSFARFLAGLVAEHPGTPPHEISKYRSLPQVSVTALVDADTKIRAMARAKEEAAEESRQRKSAYAER